MKIQDINFFYLYSLKFNIEQTWERCCTNYNTKFNLNKREIIKKYELSSSYLDTSCNFKSHQHLWKYIWDNNIQYCFLFQENIELPPLFFFSLENALNELKDLKWDIVFFKKIENAQFTKTNTFYSSSYLLTRECAGKFIALSSQKGEDILPNSNVECLLFS